VVRLVLAILASSAETKLLVFSEWKDMLSLLSKAFTLNEVSSLLLLSRPTFTSTLHRFHHDPTCRVLLLPMKGSNEGLNLTPASHVVFVEPSLSRAREEQGVGRVWRIGQRQPCHIHRVVIQVSVEERIHRRNEAGGRRVDRIRRLKEDEVEEADFNDLLRGDDDPPLPATEREEKEEVLVIEEDARQTERRWQLEDEGYWKGLVSVPSMGGAALSRLDVLGRLQRAAFFERRRREEGGKEEKEKKEEKEEKDGEVRMRPTHGLRIVHHGRSVYEDIAHQIDELHAAPDGRLHPSTSTYSRGLTLGT
jgi:hypothetical protein